MSVKRKIALVICIIVAIVSGSLAAYFALDKQNTKEVNKEVEKVAKKPKEEKVEAPAVEEKEEIPINFDELKAINPDIYGWVNIAGTEIDYPILQSETDNNYYLRRNSAGEHSIPGCIFTENYNKKDFTDFNTMVYGHYMTDNTMFGRLISYRDQAFFDSHPEITIYLPDKKLTYEIFAAVQYDDRHIMESFDFNDPFGRLGYIESLKNARSMSNVVKNDVEVNEDSHLITLSTCVPEVETDRFLVVGVLKEDK
ncbi:MAG TPA: class B sortase [Candidatus Dorea intestinavium]|nr:class B sortase [Candidatus Dorea intestinavium]